MTFFNELINKNITGVAYKNINIKKSVISYFADTGNSTIAELCKELSLSAPKINNIFNELINDGLVKDYGKVDSTGGRRPNVYGLVPESAFFVGVHIKQDHINIGISEHWFPVFRQSQRPGFKRNLEPPRHWRHEHHAGV